MWESIHLLCQNKGDGNHDNSNAEATMGWGVGGTQTVKRDHAKFCSGSSSTKDERLNDYKGGGQQGHFLNWGFLLVLFILLHFLSWKTPKDIYRLKGKSKWGGADVTYRRDGILFLKQVFWGGKAVKIHSTQVERLPWAEGRPRFLLGGRKGWKHGEHSVRSSSVKIRVINSEIGVIGNINSLLYTLILGDISVPFFLVLQGASVYKILLHSYKLRQIRIKTKSLSKSIIAD